MSDEPTPFHETEALVDYSKLQELRSAVERMLGFEGFMLDERVVEIPTHERAALDAESMIVTRDEIPACVVIRIHRPETGSDTYWRDEAIYLHDDGTANYADITIGLTAEESAVVADQAKAFEEWYDEIDRLEREDVLEREAAEAIMDELAQIIGLRVDHLEMAREAIADARTDEEAAEAQDLWHTLWEGLTVDVFESKLLIEAAHKVGVAQLTPYINTLKKLMASLSAVIKVRHDVLNRSMYVTKAFETEMILHPETNLNRTQVERLITLLDKCKDY